MASGGCCGGSEDIPCTGQVIEVKQDHAVLCWREAPDQLIYVSRDAVLTSQRHCENISLRCALKVGDVVSVRVQLTNASSEVRWTALPGTVFFIQHAVLYEGVSKITMDSEEEGHMMTERGLVRFQRRRCKYCGPFPNKLPSNQDLTNHSPRVFSGDQIRFRAISLPDGTWRAVKVSHLFADDISDWRFPHSKGHTTTAVLLGVDLPSFARGLDGLVVTAVNNIYSKNIRKNRCKSDRECCNFEQSMVEIDRNIITANATDPI